jgi:uncharacterized protein GlcG (DUF336 family)
MTLKSILTVTILALSSTVSAEHFLKLTQNPLTKNKSTLTNTHKNKEYIMLTLAQANQMIEAAFLEGKKNNFKPLTVAVLDAGGAIKVLQKQDGASLLRTEIAIGKAWGALGLGEHSRTIQKMAEERPLFITSLMNVSQGRLVPVAGGLLIANMQGDLIGAIGISGDTLDHDEQCAFVGIAAAGFKPL